MTEQYQTVYEGGTGEIVEKKSRFIATVRPVETEEEALAFIEEMKKKYWDARHNCFAYVLGERQEIMRCSDDGEPSGTAGRPMLEVLLAEEIRNVAVVVTRYFGGTLLGTGGLVRAYSQAVKAGLENCVTGVMRQGVEILLHGLQRCREGSLHIGAARAGACGQPVRPGCAADSPDSRGSGPEPAKRTGGSHLRQDRMGMRKRNKFC